MRKWFGLMLAAAAILGLTSTMSGCGNAKANPCRWTVGKVALPAEATEASRQPASNLMVLDFYADGSEKAAFSRDYELTPGQTEVTVEDLPDDADYAVKGNIYLDGECEAAVRFDADCEMLPAEE
ncbi:hypothetical protein IJT17_09890 [bacterium]|nr:hypothetical protein [bacterium]